jgi:hypothetical protein
MNNFLNDIIALRGADQAARASTLLQAAKVDKITLNNLITRLSDKSMFAGTIIPLVEGGSKASGLPIANMLSEVYSRYSDMFASSNAISLLMGNTSSILSQEIKSLEEELDSLEKALDNYSFLLTDSNCYDSSFIETFNDNLSFEEIDFNSKKLSDRSGLDFSSSEIASINSGEGTLVIPASGRVKSEIEDMSIKPDDFYSVDASIWASNCAAFISNPSVNNSISNTVNGNIGGWRVVVDSPIIIDGPLHQFEYLYDGDNSYPGAQFIVQYEMGDESPVDTIVVDPFDDYGFTLVQVVGYTSESDQVGLGLMSAPVHISKTTNIMFPKKSFKKFHLYLNQRAYLRKVNNALLSESVAENRVSTTSMIADSVSDSKLEAGNTPQVVDITSYWGMVFSTLKDSLGRQDSQLFSQGLPTYWSSQSRFIEKRTSVKEFDGIYRDRDSYTSSPGDVNSSYIQDFVRRFFGTQSSGIGAFMRPLADRFFQSNQISLRPDEPEVRSAPYPRLGELEASSVTMPSELDESFSYSDGGTTPWSTTTKWDFWLNRETSPTLDREGSPGKRYWSEKLGEWVVGKRPFLPPVIESESEYGYRLPYMPAPDPSRSEDPGKVPAPEYNLALPVVPYSEILFEPNNSYSYRYILGLRSIKIKLADYKNRAVYVSKPIGVSGDISEVKLKESSVDYLSKTNTSNIALTSVEYSVTNSPEYYNESSWKPILPFNSDIVVGERLFPDGNGVSSFRFNALNDNITLYKNGDPYGAADLSSLYLRRENSNTIYGVRIPVNSYTSTDIFTCDYVPAQDASTVSFDNYGDKVGSYISYHDGDSPGQFFYGSDNLQYQLAYFPYIDYTQVDDSTYSSSIGLSPYSPIGVTFEDGSRAVNLTDYKLGTATTLDPVSASYSFLQSGNVLIFNKPVDKNFKVFYNYFPSTLRVRVVLRSNYFETVSPKVDFYQVKSKTRKPDSRRN